MEAKDAKVEAAKAATITIGNGKGATIVGWVGTIRTPKGKVAKVELIAANDPTTKAPGQSLYDGAEWTTKVVLTGPTAEAFVAAIGGAAKVETFKSAAKARTGRGEATTIRLDDGGSIGSSRTVAAATVTDDMRAAALAAATKVAAPETPAA